MSPIGDRRIRARGLIFASVSTLLVITSCSREKPAVTVAVQTKAVLPTALFRDVTEASGVRFQFRNGEEENRFTILESLGGGVGLLDYDLDGLLDILVIGGGHFGPNERLLGYPNRLYRNEGNCRFRDVTAEVGLPLDEGNLFYGCGCAVGDFDCDGWPDLLVTGYGHMALYRNNRGKFENVTKSAGLHSSEPIQWTTSAAFGDVNGDGYPDLLVVQYVDWSLGNNPVCKNVDNRQDVCAPKAFNPLAHRLFLNNGRGSFRDVSRETGLKPGPGLGCLIVDADDDGRPDMYIANDGGGNFLYLNRGKERFDEEGLRSGVSCDETGQPGGSMGVDAADCDGSGRLSIFVTNFVGQTHFLFRNLGEGSFQNLSRPAGITAIGMNYVGFGTSFLDLENDGIEDLAITNGHVLRFPHPPHTVSQKPVLFRNTRRLGDGPGMPRFEDVSALGGPYFQAAHRGRGLAVGDLDNDGKVDLVISHCNEPVALLRNEVESRNHWLGIHLVGQGDRDAVGAKVMLESGGMRLVRSVKGGGSYLSSSDRRTVFGLGAASRVDRLTVRWRAGKTQVWEGRDLPVDRYWKLEEGKSAPSHCRRRKPPQFPVQGSQLGRAGIAVSVNSCGEANSGVFFL